MFDGITDDIILHAPRNSGIHRCQNILSVRYQITEKTRIKIFSRTAVFVSYYHLIPPRATRFTSILGWSSDGSPLSKSHILLRSIATAENPREKAISTPPQERG